MIFIILISAIIGVARFTIPGHELSAAGTYEAFSRQQVDGNMLNVIPDSLKDNASDCLGTDAVLVREGRMAYLGRCIPFAYLSDFLFIQFRRSISSAIVAAPFGLHIAYVFGLCPKKEMSRVNTCRDVTAVQHKQPVRYWANKHFVRDSVSRKLFLLPVPPAYVAVVILGRTNPQNAAAWHFLDAAKKPCFQRHSWRLQTAATLCSASFQTVATRRNCATALTRTIPKRNASGVSCIGNHRQPTKSQAKQVFEPSIRGNKMAKSHDSHLATGGGCGQAGARCVPRAGPLNYILI